MFIPDDFQDALTHRPAAQEFFNSLSDHLQYLHVRFVSEVVDPKIRQARIQEVIDILESSGD